MAILEIKTSIGYVIILSQIVMEVPVREARSAPFCVWVPWRGMGGGMRGWTRACALWSFAASREVSIRLACAITQRLAAEEEFVRVHGARMFSAWVTIPLMEGGVCGRLWRSALLMNAARLDSKNNLARAAVRFQVAVGILATENHGAPFNASVIIPLMEGGVCGQIWGSAPLMIAARLDSRNSHGRAAIRCQVVVGILVTEDHGAPFNASVIIPLMEDGVCGQIWGSALQIIAVRLGFWSSQGRAAVRFQVVVGILVTEDHSAPFNASVTIPLMEGGVRGLMWKSALQIIAARLDF